MTPWHDCAPSHSRPDGAVVAGSTHRATHRPRQLAPTRSARDTSCLPLIDPAPMAARPPSSCQCGCLTPPSSPSIGIWPGPFAFPYPSSLVSTTGRPRFGGFGVRHRKHKHYRVMVERGPYGWLRGAFDLPSHLWLAAIALAAVNGRNTACIIYRGDGFASAPTARWVDARCSGA